MAEAFSQLPVLNQLLRRGSIAELLPASQGHGGMRSLAASALLVKFYTASKEQ
jgi:hypothetical protein